MKKDNFEFCLSIAGIIFAIILVISLSVWWLSIIGLVSSSFSLMNENLEGCNYKTLKLGFIGVCLNALAIIYTLIRLLIIY